MYYSIFPPNESIQDSVNPFEFELINPYRRMDDITGIMSSNYHKTQDIIGGTFQNDFNRLN